MATRNACRNKHLALQRLEFRSNPVWKKWDVGTGGRGLRVLGQLTRCTEDEWELGAREERRVGARTSWMVKSRRGWRVRSRSLLDFRGKVGRETSEETFLQHESTVHRSLR